MNRRNKTLLIAGIIVMAASSLVGRLVITAWDIPRWTAFSFILFAELVFFGGLYVLDFAAEKTEQLFSRAGIITALSAYAVVSIGISICLARSLSFRLSRFWALQIVVLAVAAVACILILSAGKRIYESEHEKVASVALLQDHVNRLSEIAADEKAGRYGKAIGKLAEALSFTDTSRTVETDDAIADCVSSLELLFSDGAPDEEKIDAACKRLDFLIRKRSIEISPAQRGKF